MFKSITFVRRAHFFYLILAALPMLATPSHAGVGMLASKVEAERQARLQISSGVSVIYDNSTGVRVGIPLGIVEPARRHGYGRDGRNWKTPDGRLNVSTLLYDDRTLNSFFQTLASRRGRNITRREFAGQSFVLEGNDSDGTSFHVVAHARGGQIRGLSIVYANHARGELYSTVQQMLASFDPYPAVTTSSIPPPPPAPPPPPVYNSNPSPTRASPSSSVNWRTPRGARRS